MPDFLLFLLVLGILILAHELGHFLAARWRGVRVEEFGIGYPPRIATLFEAGGTIFTLNLIPLGGFVRPAGEDDPQIPGGLASSSKTTRALVLSAGPLANVLLAFAAFFLAYKFAAPDLERVMIAEVVPDTPAAEAGIMPGDLVRSVDDVQVDSFTTMQQAIRSRLGQPVRLTIQRGKQELVLQLVPRVEYPEGQGPIGVILTYPTARTDWMEASRLSIQSIGSQMVAILRLPGRLLAGEATPEETRVTGLKGIHDMLAWANEIDQASQRPFVTLNLIGVISLGLAMANLLPFPALDGGRLMFIVLEIIFRKRVSPRIESFAHAVGFAILLILMIYINLQDFVNPIQLP